MTSGSSASVISEKDSCISDRPWPVDPVAARAPPASAPQAIPTASSSLSALMQVPSTPGRYSAKYSRISVNGVMG